MSRSRWEVVYDDVRGRIERAELRDGDQVPGELHLAELHQVSRNTVRTALMRLEQEGLITAGRGRLGRTVRTYAPLTWSLTAYERGTRRDDPTRGVDDWSAGVKEQGREPHQEVTVSIELAPPHVSEWLQLEPGAMVVRRSRRRTVDNRPYQLSTSWFPERIARDTPLMEQRDVAMPGGILAAIGHPQRRLRDEITVRMPTPDESRLLELSVGTPVCQHVRIGYGADDVPVRVMQTIAPGDRNRLVYELEV
ncbi:GntR family transcriptional regulator [Streptomyces sp. URMC 125]|uniref:GntR family transcriptional regulator n=1 Tax=Streptomyces sp. URMC 125 TaxID=3423419 RepID=UPI003F1AC5F6